MDTWKGKLALVGGVILVSAAIFAAAQISGDSRRPADFEAARERGSELSDKITQASGGITEDLKKVNELDKKGQFAEAYILTNELLGKTEEIRKDAVELSAEMEKMLRSVERIRPEEAKTVALESINKRLASISYLLSYTDNLKQVFASLQQKFTRKGSPDISANIQKINEEIQMINDLNRQAQELMEKFDKLTE